MNTTDWVYSCMTAIFQWRFLDLLDDLQFAGFHAFVADPDSLSFFLDLFVTIFQLHTTHLMLQ